MKKGWKRTLCVLLTFAMLLPMTTVIPVVHAEEVELFYEDFSRLSSYAVGQKLTRADGFASVPSSTAVKRKNKNYFVQIDFASGYENPDEIVYYLHDGTYEIVDAETEGAVRTDMASYGLISGRDPNLNVGFQLKNPQLSYTDYRRVVIEAKYYFDEGADGSIYAQILRFDSTVGTETTTKNYLPLFNIDPETGNLNTNGTPVSDDRALNFGEWNTVSIVLDLVTGDTEFYLNYMLHSINGNVGYTNLTLQKDSLIIGKVHRTTTLGHIASEELDGFFRVDDVRVYTPGESTFVEVPRENENEEPLLNVTLKRGNTELFTVADRYRFLSTAGVTVNPNYFHVDPQSYNGILSSRGATLRTDAAGGIRFVTAMEAEMYENLLARVSTGEFASVSIGTLIAPLDYIKEAGAFTFSALSKLDHRTDYLDVPSLPEEGWYTYDRTGENEGKRVFAGTISGIDPSHFDDAFAGRGYVRITHESGVSTYFYADWDGYGVSLHELAMGRLAEEDVGEEERAFLEASVLNPIENLGGEVWDITLSQNRLFFRVNDDIFACLTYAGNGGWRLKAQADGYLGFTGVGAAQALAYYMSEEPNDTVLPITCTVEGKWLSVTCEDGSRIRIALDGSFQMIVYSPSGKEVSRLIDVGMTNGQLLMRGRLDETEGVYGGGERFDSVNRRGLITRLYSEDGWNNSKTSYMVIPLFFTSRGGGFFFNRYEDMLVDFGKTVSNEWSVALHNDAMDCYLYATESGKEVIADYARLTGTTSLPEEWAYGEMICRYSVDLRSFENDVDTTNKDGAPSGRSVKTLVTKLLEAGMKPSAMVMEPWGYTNISADTESAIASRTELQTTIDWLEEQGIRTMLYMRVGGTVNAKMVGYKEEYFVYADVNEKGTVRYTSRIPYTSGTGETGNPDISTSRSGLYLDITNPEAVNWYFDTIWGQLVDMGIDGVKIDFCELLPDDGYEYDFEDGKLSVHYHWHDPSRMVKGGEHHSYPVYFISEFYKRMNERKLANGETDGFYLLSRGGGIGSQRNPFLWAGDQARQFDKLDDQLMSVVTSGLSGVPNMTYDMAGYRYNGKVMPYANEESFIYESEMMARAVEFTAFMVNIQTHGTVRNAYELSDGAQEIYRVYTELHEALAPYITKYMTIASEMGVPAVRHPVLEFQDDENVYDIKDQFLLGEGLMVAPILARNTYSRSVYLPEGEWTDLLTGEVLTGGQTYNVSANIGQVPLYVNNASEDAAWLLEFFTCDNWKKVMAWDAPLDSTATAE